MNPDQCQHVRMIKHGLDRKGKQRYQCVDCGRTSIDGRAGRGNNKIPIEKEQQISELIAVGKTIRQIRAATGCSPWTIQVRMRSVTPPIVNEKKIGKAGHCDFCGSRIKGKREFNRRTRRTRHKFCQHNCYLAFYRELRDKRRCKRCGTKRKDISAQRKGFVKGLCNECYYAVRNRKLRSAVVAVQSDSLRRELESIG